MPHRDDALASILHSQGYGTRKDCVGLVRDGRVEIAHAEAGEATWRLAADPAEPVDKKGLLLRVDGKALPYREVLYIALHKPANSECSHNPTHYRSVFELLPQPFLNRGIQAVGRLDADTTGLLLLSDSGAFIHHFTSPKRHVAKTYRVGAKHPIAPDQVERLATGVVLKDEDAPTLPATVTLRAERECDLVIQEGRYHQVKRMLAAVGNRVETIHRTAIAGLVLGDSLAPGDWRFLEAVDLEHLGYREP